MKKIFLSLMVILLVLTGCAKEEKTDKIKVVSTLFPGYDFARAVGGDNVDLTMLVSPGSESHSYDPTPKDIVKISESDIFIYVGGESEEWVKGILENVGENTKVIRLMDLVEVKKEEIVEGMEEEHDHEDEDHEDEEGEYDEHVWTSLTNSKKIIEKIKENIILIDNENKDYYENNASKYIAEINKLDVEIKGIVENSKTKEIVFADRFPFRYFVDEYNLDYRAAFPGCSEKTEASAKTIVYLVNYIKDNNIPVVFYIELSNQKLADTLVEDTNAKKLEFQSGHNLTKDEFDKGTTYVDIMKKNVENLKEALR